MARILIGWAARAAVLSIALAIPVIDAARAVGVPGGPTLRTSDESLVDLYKRLHQAWNGPGHMIPSPEAAAAYLRQEWEELGACTEGEALIDTLVADAPFVRLNLRPYRDAGGSADSLLAAFLRSAAAQTDTVAFARDWEEVGRRCSIGDLPFSRAAFDSLDEAMRPAGYPAVHHSATYRSRHLPAYRVLTVAEALRLVGSLPHRPRNPPGRL